jgi:UPF0176 protein
MTSYAVAAFYKFVSLPHYRDIRAPLLAFCHEQGLVGSILLAAEGINATIAGPSKKSVDALLRHLGAMPEFKDLEHKASSASERPFTRMKVRLKKEIVTFGRKGLRPGSLTGEHVSKDRWNQLLEDPAIPVIDTRNDYEVEIGTFKDAINPKISDFGEFAEFVEENYSPRTTPDIAMFCTGGIRCEKASALMLQKGYRNVYQLDGGILNYLEDTKEEASFFVGECYVFDERVALTHGLKEGQYESCPSCGHPVGEKARTTEQYEEGVTCPNCFDDITPERRARSMERQRQKLLAQMRDVEKKT